MPRTNQPSKTQTKPRKAAPATKHGYGIPRETIAKVVVPKQPSIKDIQAARERRYVLDHNRTDKDVIIAVLGTALFMFVAHMFTNAWYGF